MVPVPFVVLATARTGSWHLVELLNRHPNIISNGEVLNNDDTSWPPDSRPAGATAWALVRWALRRAPGRGQKGEVYARGLKILDEQMLPEVNLWHHLSATPNLRVVLLVRTNMLDSLRSKKQAEATGVWQVLLDADYALPPVVALSAAECLDYFDNVAAFISKVRTDFGDRMLEVTYEDICSDKASTLARIHAFLGAPPMHSADVVLRRQEPRPTSEVVVGYDLLVEELRRSRWGDARTRPSGFARPW